MKERVGDTEFSVDTKSVIQKVHTKMHVLNSDKKVTWKSHQPPNEKVTWKPQQPPKISISEPCKSHVAGTKSYVEAVKTKKVQVDKNT